MGFHVRNNNPSVRAGRSGGGRQASQLSKRHFYVLFCFLFFLLNWENTQKSMSVLGEIFYTIPTLGAD